MSELNEMYSRVPGLVLGFHGCRKEVYEKVLYSDQPLTPSTNKYDWLGNGIYFWENSYERALEWANTHYGPGEGSVIGAVISLGRCLDLTDYASVPILKEGYAMLLQLMTSAGKEMPQNKHGRSKTDLLLRNLDCAVIEQIHAFYREKDLPAYDSVRGIFTEGEETYEGAAFQEKTHTQLCIVNPNCIKGYFKALNPVPDYPIP